PVDAFSWSPLDVEFVIQELGHRMDAQSRDNPIQGGTDGSSRGTHLGNSRDRQLAMILSLHLSDRDTELVPQPITDAAHDLPLVLQTTRLPNQQPHTQRANNHQCRSGFLARRCRGVRLESLTYFSSLRCTCSMRYASMTSSTLMSS